MRVAFSSNRRATAPGRTAEYSCEYSATYWPTSTAHDEGRNGWEPNSLRECGVGLHMSEHLAVRGLLKRCALVADGDYLDDAVRCDEVVILNLAPHQPCTD